MNETATTNCVHVCVYVEVITDSNITYSIMLFRRKMAGDKCMVKWRNENSDEMWNQATTMAIAATHHHKMVRKVNQQSIYQLRSDVDIKHQWNRKIA